MPVLVSVILINGCTVLPGNNMSTMGKDVIKQQDADFDIDHGECLSTHATAGRTITSSTKCCPAKYVAGREISDISTGSARGMS